MVEKKAVGNCCVQFWRFTFMVLNILFFYEQDVRGENVHLAEQLIGLALIGLAIYLLATQNDLQFLTGSRFASGGVLILIAGLITSIISFVGIVAAIGMWWWLFMIYLILMVAIVILEIVAGILGFVFRDDLVDAAERGALDAISQYRVEEADDFKNDVNMIIDFIQNRFDCCGYTSFDDWFNTEFINTTMAYPDSCNCTLDDTMATTIGSGSGQGEFNNAEECMAAPLVDDQIIYRQSCNESVNEFLENNLIIVGAVGISFGVFEIIGIVLGIALCVCACCIKKDDDGYDFTKAV